LSIGAGIARRRTIAVIAGFHAGAKQAVVATDICASADSCAALISGGAGIAIVAT